jgi:hypothetical protein
MARLDAAKFGPQFGKDYSGADNVTLVVGLDESAVEAPPVKTMHYKVMSDGREKKATLAPDGKIMVGGTPEKDAILLPPAAVIAPGAGGYGGYPAPARAAGATATAKTTAGTGGAK